jgi:putative transposase
MPARTTPFGNNEYYHVFNRGVARMPIFTNTRDYQRFIKTVLYYQIDGPKPRFSLFNPNLHTLNEKKKIVNITSYCLMPNHFHFILQQLKENGISEFVGKLANSYTKYYNTKNKRVGPLFQGQFKAVFIETDEQLLHLSRYIHLNPLVGYVSKNLDNYSWSSYHEYIDSNASAICSKEIVIKQFKSTEDYKQFILDQEDFGKKLEEIKHQLLDYTDV